MFEILATPYVPGLAKGSISHNPEHDNVILVVSGMALPINSRPAGFVVIEGAIFSHSMLGLLAKGIPTVIVTTEQAADLIDGQMIQINGYSGAIKSLSATTPGALKQPSVPQLGQPVMSSDGVAVMLRASVRNVIGVKQAKKLGAESIGLVRSEFLGADTDVIPDSLFYQQAFSELITVANPLTVTLRLLDLAADKLPNWMPGAKYNVSTLGQQGIRLYNDELLHTVVTSQLDSIIQADAKDKVKLLVPYVTTLEEMRDIKEWISSRIKLPIGAMIETPAAALEIAGHMEIADFAALGTNDLMQCLFAADRDDPTLRHYLDPYSPMLYRFLAQVAREADEKLPLVQVCGLLSQLPGVFPVMLGLGFRAFSVDAVYIPFLAATVREMNIDDVNTLAKEACLMKTSYEVQALLRAYMRLSPISQ